jgi:hypothetical protein
MPAAFPFSDFALAAQVSSIGIYFQFELLLRVKCVIDADQTSNEIAPCAERICLRFASLLQTTTFISSHDGQNST